MFIIRSGSIRNAFYFYGAMNAGLDYVAPSNSACAAVINGGCSAPCTIVFWYYITEMNITKSLRWEYSNTREGGTKMRSRDNKL